MLRCVFSVFIFSIQFTYAAAVAPVLEATGKIEDPVEHAPAALGERAEGEEQLTLTARGALHKPSKVVRKEDNANHDHSSIKHQGHAGKSHSSHHHKGKHASVHQHQHENQAKLLEIDEANEPAPSPAAAGASKWVTCGGHKAETCAKCTITDASRATVFNHGNEWCHGDCIWDENPTKVVKTGDGSVINCFDKEGYNHSGTKDAAGAGFSTPKPSAAEVADLDNPNITKQDLATIEAAAKDAIKEENVENAEKGAKDAEDAKKSKMTKIWILIICIFSVLLGICAVISCVALVVFCMMAEPKADPNAVEDEGIEEPLLEEVADDGGAEPEF